jgi:hypothetical protein
MRQQVVLRYSRRRMAAFCVSRVQDKQGDGTILTERARQWRCPALATARSRGGHLGGWSRGHLDSLLIKFAVRGSMQSGFNLQPIAAVCLRRAYPVEHKQTDR